MNKNVFRLVYSKHLGMFVPAPESASGNAGKASASPARSLRRLLAAMLASSLVLSASLSMADPLDGLIPTGGLVQGGNPGSWEGATYVKNGAVMDINQNIPKAILNWQNLNLAKGETLNFHQESASWSALNRIHSNDPSNIAGIVNALVPDGKGHFNPIGNLYFINSNGIIFGNGAQISVGSLTASSLNITDKLFKNGFINTNGTSNLSFEDTLNLVDVKKGFVEVASGAKLNAFAGGRIMLLAPMVTNAGVINTPEGQTILAAGQKVYLASSSDLAGLLVEVSSGGTATNLGDIVSKLGNVTMVGLAVNQEGRVSASTSVRANGSIKLLARESIYDSSSGAILSQRGGYLNVAKVAGSSKESLTNIDVEVGDKEEILKSQLTNANGFKVLGVSKVQLSGGVISINGNITAHGGDVEAIARFNSLDSLSRSGAVSATRVYLGSDASIDVSGLDATAPMSRNQIALQLYSEQLKETPILRGTDFLGKTIYVDARKGTDLIAADALEAAKAIKGITIAEVMSKAGTVNFEASLGDVILANGSKVDVSGGSISYEAGFVRESQLVYKGNTVAISATNKNTPYEGFGDTYSAADRKWGVTRTWDIGNRYGQYYQAFTAGSDAGAVSVVATNSLLAADLRGFKKDGYYQRDGQLLGGGLNLNLNYASGVSPNFEFVAANNSVLANNFSVVGEWDANSQKFGKGDPLTSGLIQVETTIFSTDKKSSSGGFSRFSLNALAGNIAVKAPVKIIPKGSLDLLTTGQINVIANIISPGGALAIKGGDISLGDNVKISTSGSYTNDTLSIAGAMLANVVKDAGVITIVENDIDKGGLSIGRGVSIEANAGAWLNSANQLTGGKGGSITLLGVASQINNTPTTDSKIKVTQVTNLEDTIISAYGFSSGGSLTLSAYRNIQAGGRSPFPNLLPATVSVADSKKYDSTLWLPESFFSRGGFSQYNIITTMPISSIMIGDAEGASSSIHPQSHTLITNSGYRALGSESDMALVAKPIFEPEYLRKPTSISFSSFGKLTVYDNAIVELDRPGIGAGGNIFLKSNDQMNIFGKLIAPAGNVGASIVSKINDYLIYDDTLSLYVGQSAFLSAHGAYIVSPTNDGLIKSAISDAGSITLDGGERAVVVLKEGSVLDVSGISGKSDVNLQSGYSRQNIDGAAGTISISSRNGIVIDGDMRASALGGGRDGSLILKFSGAEDTTPGSNYPNSPRIFNLTSSKSLKGGSLEAGKALTDVIGGGAISKQQLTDAGFSSLELDVNRDSMLDKVRLSEGLNLYLPSSIILKTSLLELADGSNYSMKSNYVLFAGGTLSSNSAGNGELMVDAKWIDLSGEFIVSNAKKIALKAELDIRALGNGAGIGSVGSFNTSGRLELSARRVYPVSNSAFLFKTTGTTGLSNIIEITSPLSKDIPTAPLSAGGILNFRADEIAQKGYIFAPLGQINLFANGTLTLAEGSYTSTSANNLIIPYGATRLGGLVMHHPSKIVNENSSVISKFLESKINMQGLDVQMKDGAHVNLSGGGNTLAYEWIQGIGGSSDILAKTDSFAVLPSIKKGEYAPFDYNYTQQNTVINLGDSIHLTGVQGLPDGDYALLPARYALLPGAFLVQSSTKAITQATSALQVDASTLVSTYKSNGGYNDSNYSTFKVTNASIFQTAKGEVSKAPSEYKLTYGNEFFTKLAENAGTSIPRLSSDAGQLVVSARDGLILDAKIQADIPFGARGAMVDITSNKMKVVSELSKREDKPKDILEVTARSLNSLNVESLLLGGTRTAKSDGSTEIVASAESLEFANDSQNGLLLNELIATSSQKLVLASGASIASTPKSAVVGKATLKTTGTGALLAVSSLNNLEIERAGAIVTGDLIIEGGSKIEASRSVLLDSRDAARLDGTVTVSKAGSISLGAGLILLGDSEAAQDKGLKISNTLLSSFGQLSKVTLNSYNNINIYGAVDIGNKELDLNFNAVAIVAQDNNQTAKLTANNFILKNLNVSAYNINNNVPKSNTTLILDANNIELVGGIANSSISIAGFNEIQLNAAKEISFAGVGTSNFIAASTNLKSSRISAATASNFTIAATGEMTTALPTMQSNLLDASGLGANLTITASRLTLGGKVDLPSGQLIAKATGDLTVSGTAQLKATSVPVNFDKYTEYTPAGKITLQTDLGNVVVDSGGLVDVSGKQASGNVGGDAGSINIISKGSTMINGSLKALATADNKAGSFVLDTNTLPDFSKLNSALNTGGFNNLRDMRVRSGDVTIAAGDTVTAKHVILSADAGKIDVFGSVDASGSNGGKIEIYAKHNLTLKAGSKLLAKGTGEALVAGDSFVGAGGRVLLSSLSLASTSAISAGSGALIDVSGDQQGATLGEKGSVTMRAFRGTSGTTNTVNVDTTATSIVKGAESVRLEGVRIYTSTSFNTTTPNIVRDTNAFYTENPGAGVYTTQDGANVTILPNIEVRSSATPALADLTVGAAATNLNMRNFGALQAGKGGTLTLRSNNNLNINGTLSDGFNGPEAYSVLQTGNTFSFNLVAGADMSSANQLVTIKSTDATKGNFTLASSKIIRTGTGEINIAAGGGLTMGSVNSVIYTVGRTADVFATFKPPRDATSSAENGITGASYLTQGGDINIKINGDILGKVASLNTQQLITPWLFRQGGGTDKMDVSWWVRPDLFRQGIAALGGGNVTVNAGGSITNFSVSVPTNARYDSLGNVSLNGGGDVIVEAGQNISSGIYFAGKGNVSLLAGGLINNASSNIKTVLALQDAKAKVYGFQGASIETVFNPTLWAQASINAGDNNLATTGKISFYLTYGKDSTVALSSLLGNVSYGTKTVDNITNKASSSIYSEVGYSSYSLEVQPGNVVAISFNGDIELGRLILAPSPNQNLSLLAKRDVKTIDNSILVLSNADLTKLPSVTSPLADPSALPTKLNDIRKANTSITIPDSNIKPIDIIAVSGNITMVGDTKTGVGGAGISSNRSVYVFAGLDLSINANIQHTKSNEISKFRAGRDVVMPIDPLTKISLAGPGELLVQAGRNVNLGSSDGIVTVANTLNSALPSQGASVTLLAGLGSEGSAIASYVETYINPNGRGPSTLQASPSLLAEYKSETKKAVASYMRNMTGNAVLSEETAMIQYLALDLDRQSIFAYRHFSSELLASGKGYAKSQNHERGDTAIASLFPSDRTYHGDLSLYNSQIVTSRDGSVDILTPGGFINAGVPTQATTLTIPKSIGIVTQRGGEIRAFAETGFQVEQSKIITQYGSDITVWVNNGDIDAGRGSKTALSVPQRVVSTNADGKTTIEAKGAAAGSGIRAQTYDPDGPTGAQIAPPLGSVALIAPRGILNASEAGIAAGNFLAVATQVLGANNITVTGTSSGVPVASTGSVAGAMTGVSNAAADATKSIANDITRQATTNTTVKTPMPSLISVEVIGLGD